jgi:hypothetical protein
VTGSDETTRLYPRIGRNRRLHLKLCDLSRNISTALLAISTASAQNGAPKENFATGAYFKGIEL